MRLGVIDASHLTRGNLMRADVRIDGDGYEQELRSLHGWLGHEPAVRKAATVTLRERPATPGAMGSLLDALELVTSNGWSAAAFALSVASKPNPASSRRWSVSVI